MSRNSITPSRALLTCGVSVRITMPSAAGIAQEAMGFGERSISTRHMRQFPAMESRSWKQKCGISLPASMQACITVEPGSNRDLGAVDGKRRHRLRPQAAAAAAALSAAAATDLLGQDAPLELGPEVADQPLHRPRGGIAEGADGMPLNLPHHVPQHGRSLRPDASPLMSLSITR